MNKKITMSTKLYIATFCHDLAMKNNPTIWPPIMILSNSTDTETIAKLLLTATNEHEIYQEIMHDPEKKLFFKDR